MSPAYKLNNQSAGVTLTKVETNYTAVAPQYQAEYDKIVVNVTTIETNLATKKSEVLAAIESYKEIMSKFNDSKTRSTNIIKVNKNANSNLSITSRDTIKGFYGEYLGYKEKYDEVKALLGTQNEALIASLATANEQLNLLTGETFEIKDKENGKKEINNTVKWKINGANAPRAQYLKGKILDAMSKKANSVGSALLSDIEKTKGKIEDSYIDLWVSQWFDSGESETPEVNLVTAIPVLEAKWNDVGNYLKQTILSSFLNYYKTIISAKQGSFEAELLKFNAEIAKVKPNGNMSNVSIDAIAGFFVIMESENELLKSYFLQLKSIFTKNKNTFYNNGSTNPNTNYFRRKTSANAPNDFYVGLLTQIEELDTKMNDLDTQMSAGKTQFINSTTAYKVALTEKFTEIKDGLIGALTGCLTAATSKLNENETKTVINKLSALSAQVVLPNPKTILGNNLSNSIKSINNAKIEQRLKFGTTLNSLSTGLTEIGKIVPIIGQKSNTSNSAVSPGAVGNNGKNWRNNVLTKFPTGTEVTYRSKDNKTNRTGIMGAKTNLGNGKRSIPVNPTNGQNVSQILSPSWPTERKLTRK
jgi:hypothetical protein